MNSFKKNIYKTPKIITDQPLFQETWYVSETYGSSPVSGEWCKPIDIQVYKNPNSIPVNITDVFYTDISQNTFLPEGLYGVSNSILNPPSGSYDVIRVGSNGEVLAITTEECNIELKNLQTIYITDPAQNPCSLFIEIPVKIDADDINASNEITANSQLYTNNSTNSNYVPLDPQIALSGYPDNSNVGVGLSTSSQSTSPIQSMPISSNGILGTISAC